MKNKFIAGALGVVLGGLGVHRFYINDIKGGLLYLVMCFFTSGLTFIFGWAEAILFFCLKDEAFEEYISKWQKKKKPIPVVIETSGVSKIEQLETLYKMKFEGKITDEEFKNLKKEIM